MAWDWVGVAAWSQAQVSCFRGGSSSPRIRSRIVSESQPDLHGVNGSRHRVAVVFGGTSSEHGVSCLTAAGVLSALDRDRYDPIGVGITRSGRWVVVDDQTIAKLRVEGGTLPELSEDAAD